VGNNFAMRIPLYFEVDGRIVRAGYGSIRGSSTVTINMTLPKKPKRVLLDARHDLLASDITIKEQ